MSASRNLHEVIFFCRGRNCQKLAYTLDSAKCPSDIVRTWKYKVTVKNNKMAKNKNKKQNKITWPDAGMGLKVSCAPGSDNSKYVGKLI